MKTELITIALGVALGVANPLPADELPPSLTTPNKVETSIGALEYKDGAPSKETAQKVYDHLDLMHGVEAFTNAFRGVSAASHFKGINDAGCADNTSALIFSELMDSKSVAMTYNADTVYFLANLNVTDGPLVVETPPESLGTINDIWFHWVTDFGFPGPDRGEGGRYLLVPPGYKGELPQGGYFVVKLRTFRASVMGRSFLENNDPKPPVALIKKTLKIYPYVSGGYGTSIASALEGQAKLALNKEHKLDWSFLRPHEPVKFIEGTGKVMNTIAPIDFTYFEVLNDLVQKEPADALDPEIMGSLAAVGIVKGKPFKPDVRMKKILTDAAAIGTAAGRTVDWRTRPSEGFHYYPNSAWTNMLWVGGYNFEAPPPAVAADGAITLYPPTGARTLNSRTAYFFLAVYVSPAMMMRITGVGSNYLAAFVDASGEFFDGAKTYKVTLPRDIPAEKFWSVTVYDNQTRSMLDTPQRYPRAGSQSYPSPAAEPNADGSTTVYFSPKQPEGVKPGNWIQTMPGKGWFTLLRVYSPLEPFFTKEWRPSEIELVR